MFYKWINICRIEGTQEFFLTLAKSLQISYEQLKRLRIYVSYFPYISFLKNLSWRVLPKKAESSEILHASIYQKDTQMLGQVSWKEKGKWHISYVQCCFNIFCFVTGEGISRLSKRNGKTSNGNNKWMLLKLKELDVYKKTEWLLKGVCQGVIALINLIRPRILPLVWQVQNFVAFNVSEWLLNS